MACFGVTECPLMVLSSLGELNKGVRNAFSLQKASDHPWTDCPPSIDSRVACHAVPDTGEGPGPPAPLGPLLAGTRGVRQISTRKAQGRCPRGCPMAGQSG